MLRRLALACLLSSHVLVAQDAPLLVQLTVAGPSAWRAKLGPTDVGGMFASERAEPMWRAWTDRIEAAVRGVRADDAAFAAERERVLAWAGALHFVAWLDQPEDAVHVPRWSLAVIAEPDAAADADAVASAAKQWLERLGDGASNAWRDLRASEPLVHEGRVIAVLAEDEDRETATARAKSHTLPRLGRAEVVRGEVHVPALLGLLRDRAFERGVATELVGPATQRVVFSLGAVGPRVKAELAVHFGEGARGLPGVIGGAAPSRIDALVPGDVASRVAFGFDTTALWDTTMRARAVALESTVEKEAEFVEKRMGIDPRKELFAHVENGAMLAWRSRAQDEAVEEAMLADTCLVLALREGAEVEKQVADFLQWLGGWPEVESDGVVTAHFGETVRVSVGFGVACIAVGSKRDRQVEDVLVFASERRPGPAPEAAATSGGHLDVAATAVRDAYAWMRTVAILVTGAQEWPSVRTVAEEARKWKGLLRDQSLERAKVEVDSGAELRVVVSW